MTKPKGDTKDKIVQAANTLFYLLGVKATSVDAIADKAGVTKRTVYYHFASKDDLIAAYLRSRDQQNLAAYQQAFAEQDGEVTDKVAAIFANVARATSHPKWRGCGFQRTAGELANKPGHPAMKAASWHKKNVEQWLTEAFIAAGLAAPALTARQVFLLLEGALSSMLIHHDPAYITDAGQAAAALVAQHALEANRIEAK
ncbi:TetR/AcrR family transcriptional regulator [Spongiibacter marinus]|uniref:TetR/AcrR family transcriptional regulator n=2 Tax=Spongiibacter marinus TaxID=354246 RepID=UPI0035BE6F98